MKVKVSEASGAVLDWMVAKCEFPDQPINVNMGFPYLVFGRFKPSIDWAQGGPIIEREKIDVGYLTTSDIWYSVADATENKYEKYGPTPLIAAMRCYVASKLGEEVEVPDELT